MEHVTETQLNEYLDGLMDVSVQTRIKAHLSDCADCRERLASLQAIFQVLAALPEETLERDLTQSVMEGLPHKSAGWGWRLAFAMQAGVSLGLLVAILPFLAGHIARILPEFTGRLAFPEVKFPNPLAFHFSLPVIHLPHQPSLALPILINHANFDIWLILGIAAVLLFAVGNFSLIFRSRFKARTRK